MITMKSVRRDWKVIKVGRITWPWYRDPLICYWLLTMVFMAVFILDNCVLNYSKSGEPELVDMDEQISDSDIISTINDIKFFDDALWRNLSYEKRATACEKIVQLEARHLGLSKDLQLRFENIDEIDENATGLYYDDTETVVIRNDLLESNYCRDQVLETIFHECHHAYSYDLIDAYKILPDKYKRLYLLREAKEYDNEINIKGYVTPTDDNYIDYYFQKYESKSREYAKSRLFEYLSVLSDEDNAAQVVIHSIY